MVRYAMPSRRLVNDLQQQGGRDVAFWHICDLLKVARNFRSRGISGCALHRPE
jgi:hypothetical protein